MSTNNLLEMFRDTAIKAHIGYKHEGPWDKCEWIECEDRRKMINSNLAGADEQNVGDEERATLSRLWSDEFPEVEETFYWLRHKQNHADINVGLLRDGTLLLAEGTTHGKSRRKDFEYSPASPSDFEQLRRLRAAAEMALKWLDWIATDPETSVIAPGFTSQEAAAALREALAHTGGQS